MSGKEEKVEKPKEHELLNELQIFKITRTEEVSGAHFLPNHRGKCKNLHGHNWKVVVEVVGTLCEDTEDPEFGMVIDYGVIKDIVQSLDHKDINEVIPNPTAENITKYLAEKILNSRDRISDVIVTVWETSNSSVQYAMGWMEKSPGVGINVDFTGK
jgi:6-pyruvoyltetrahydropterin/6-carboxytetrahydropterin synthase